ncbi:MAG TPA: NAD(P)H-binding protein, partial [Thermomicrobiales bacterium]|nr:NAD(P)H-binding protein [Thermomicrobiales bacterium]
MGRILDPWTGHVMSRREPPGGNLPAHTVRYQYAGKTRLWHPFGKRKTEHFRFGPRHFSREERAMRILVTGGTGFVGSRIVERVKDAHDVVLLQRAGGGKAVPAGVTTLEGDVTDPVSLSGKLEGFDAVIHLVAIIEEHGDATFDGVIRRGTENVVAAARAGGVPRFIHMSALGARDDPAYPYHQAKWRAEQ